MSEMGKKCMNGKDMDIRLAKLAHACYKKEKKENSGFFTDEDTLDVMEAMLETVSLPDKGKDEFSKKKESAIKDFIKKEKILPYSSEFGSLSQLLQIYRTNYILLKSAFEGVTEYGAAFHDFQKQAEEFCQILETMGEKFQKEAISLAKKENFVDDIIPEYNYPGLTPEAISHYFCGEEELDYLSCASFEEYRKIANENFAAMELVFSFAEDAFASGKKEKCQTLANAYFLLSLASWGMYSWGKKKERD